MAAKAAIRHGRDETASAGTHRASALRLVSGSFFLVFLGAGALQQYVGPYLVATYHLKADTGTLPLATVYLVAFIGLTFTTYSIAWLGEYWAQVAGTLAYALFGAVAFVSGNIVVLILAATVWGWGSSVLWTAGTSLVLDQAGASGYGRATGTLFTGVYVGQALGVVLLGVLMGRLGPRGMVACAVALTLLGAVAALLLPRRRQPRARPKLLNPFSVLASATTRWAALILLLSSSGFGLLLGVFGQVVATAYGLAAVGWVTAGFYVARIPAGGAGGHLIDRLGRRPVLAVALLCSAGALLLTALVHRPWLLVLCAVMLGVQAAVVPVGLTAWVGDRAAARDRPTTYAAVQLWFNVGTGLAVLGGQHVVYALGGWQGCFAFFAAIFVVCAALTYPLE